jgi:hypothetical protein
MSKKEISWILKAKDSISGVLKSVGGKFKSFAAGGIAGAKKLMTIFAAVGAAVIGVGARMVRAYQVQAQAVAKLTAVLRATGYAAGFTTSQLKEQAAELQKQTGIGDEVILSMQGILASFKNISGAGFKGATKAILDMSTVMKKAGQDTDTIEQSAIQVGKALNDPIKGIAALSRVGVTFTETQKEQIKTLQESGDLMGAQSIILKELESEFGGAAEGVDANVKSYSVFKAALGDVQEEIGRAITEQSELTDGFKKASDFLEWLSNSGHITLWAERLTDAAKLVMEYLGPVVKVIMLVSRKMKEGLQKGAGFAGALLGGADLETALKIANEAPEMMRKDTERRLKEIRKEKAEKKAAIAATEQAEMVSAHKVAAVQKAEAEAVAKAKAAAAKAAQVDDVITDLKHRIKLQTLLNKGMETEAELLRIQKQLGRDLSESEKARLTEQINELRELEKAQNTVAAPAQAASGAGPTSLERIGAILGGGIMTDPRTSLQKALKTLAEKQLKVQEKILEKTGSNLVLTE